VHADHHLAKALRIEQTMTRKLDIADDYEMIIWCCIHGGAQLLNVVFHNLTITDERSDMIHTDLPKLDRQLPSEVGAVMAWLKSIEDLGPRYVRGNEVYDPNAVKECLATYAKIKAFAFQSQRANAV
jgi:hypothetical protein